MCYNISINTVHFKVTEDLPCYKIVSTIKSRPTVVKSLYYKKKYNFNEKYTLEKQIKPIAEIYIEEGYHSYRCFNEDLKRLLSILNELQNQSKHRKLNLAIVKCIIPAGSDCYLDIVKEVFVSDAIIITQKINPVELLNR